MKKAKPITVGELEEFLKNKPKKMIVHVMDRAKGYPLAHMLYWEQPKAPIKILLARSIYD